MENIMKIESIAIRTLNLGIQRSIEYAEVISTGERGIRYEWIMPQRLTPQQLKAARRKRGPNGFKPA